MAKAKKEEKATKVSPNAEKAKATVQEFVKETKAKKEPKEAKPAAWKDLGDVMRPGTISRSMQPWVLKTINDNPRLTVAEIAKNLGIEEARVGRIIRALETNGLITREPADAKLAVATFSANKKALDQYEEEVKKNEGHGLKRKLKKAE